MTKPVRFSKAQVTALCGGELPHAGGFAWERVAYFLLEDGSFEPYDNRHILPGPSIAFVRRSSLPNDHWSNLANRLRDYMKQVTDERLIDLYRKLYADGWADPLPMPLTTRNAHLTLRDMMMKAVSIETIERREGRVPSVF